MNREQLDPPRQPWETATYEEDPFELGDIENSQLTIVKDFLPLPEDLVRKEETARTTLVLDKSTLTFFKEEADRLGVSFQKMMRNLLKQYADHHRNDKNLSR